MNQKDDKRYMERCFQLAKKGLGNTSPNPLVGAVIVHQNTIIGEGYHKKLGDLHAEPNAINSVKDKRLITNSTLYVNLEPCNHFGKTPPCTDAVINSKFKRVVISNIDSNPKVNGIGIQKLREAGIDVTTGVLEEEGRRLNQRFFTLQEKKLPYIILKWAQTANGYINHTSALKKGALIISSIQNSQRIHLWRSQEDGILIGAKTFLNDKPQLTNRLLSGKSPIPILMLDKGLDVDFTIWDNNKFIVIARNKPQNLPKRAKWIMLEPRLIDTLSALKNENISSIIVEGGSKTHQLFIDQELWDEARVTTAKKNIEEGVEAAKIKTKQLIKEDNYPNEKISFYINPNSI